MTYSDISSSTSKEAINEETEAIKCVIRYVGSSQGENELEYGRQAQNLFPSYFVWQSSADHSSIKHTKPNTMNRQMQLLWSDILI